MKERQTHEQMLREEEEKRRLIEELKRNKDKVESIQQRALEKIEEKAKVI